MSGHKTYPESYLPNKSGYILELPDLRSRQKWNTAVYPGKPGMEHFAPSKPLSAMMTDILLYDLSIIRETDRM